MGNTVLIARPLWPVMRHAASILSSAGYRVQESSGWGRLLESGTAVPDLSGVLAGEYGNTAEELEILTRFRERNGALGVPVVLVGGMNAMLRAERFRAAGADLVLPADISPGLLADHVRPLLRYGALYRTLSDRNRELREASLRDDLTGLPNRRHFSHDLDRSVQMARRIGKSLSCIILDIDDFKNVNDTYGQQAGDGVIRQMGAVISGAKRTYDTVARLGGDEFAWLLMDADPRQALLAAGRAQRIVMESAFDAGPETLRLTATFGVSSLMPGMELCADDLVGNADRALYWGKESGKNVVRFYPPKKMGNDAATDPYIS